MKMDNLEKRLADLHSQVERHNRLYYKEGTPEITDKAYDDLLREVQELEKELGYTDPNSPTQQVGDDRVAGFAKVKHRVPMLSISNTYSPDAMRQELNKLYHYCDDDITFVAEPKVDGIAVSLIYQDGLFKQAITRGDGREGDDVTVNVSTIESLPKTIVERSLIEVRGELYMDLEEFAKYNLALPENERFANPRNACAGTVKHHSREVVAGRPLRFVGYTLLAKQIVEDTHLNELQRLDALGVPTLIPLGSGDVGDMWDIVDKFRNNNGEYPFATDGVVVRVNEKSWQEQLGNTNKSPRWMIAFKCEPEHAETRLLDVELTVGRTGTITPTGVVETTLLSGTEVSRANLHNPKNIRDKDIRIGDIVDVVKAGEIIPQVTKVLYDRRTGSETPIVIPTHCPSCKGPVVDENTRLYCPNPECPSRQFEGIVYFASKGCMDIDGLGPSRVSELINCGLLSKVTDLYYLTEDDLRNAGLGPQVAKNLIEAIETSKGADVTRVLQSLGIRGIGGAACSILIDRFGSIMELMNVPVEDLVSIRSIGPILAQSVYDYFHDVDNRKMVEELLKLGLHGERDPVEDSPNISLRCVITGAIPGIPRTQLAKKLLEKGILVEDRITKKTQALLLGETGASGSKVNRAKEMGILIEPLSKYISS